MGNNNAEHILENRCDRFGAGWNFFALIARREVIKTLRESKKYIVVFIANWYDKSIIITAVGQLGVRGFCFSFWF
ncbi:TPA: hypothetical protein DGH83_01315 [Candidatus Peregrinibacteria bacterium]|nr:hypothetical protein [Candidatus Peregrinibacteria bacterium]